MLHKYKTYLKNTQYAKNTKKQYYTTVKQYFKEYNSISINNLKSYKLWLIDNYQPRTVNAKLQGINSYLTFIEKPELKLQFVRIQQKPFLEKVISEADYKYFKRRLKKDNEFYYFVVWFLTATGARASELVKIKAEHVKTGHMDIYTKKGKLRRIYIPQKLQKEALVWLDKNNITSGPIFLNKRKHTITTRGIASSLKKYAVDYGLDPTVIYPHSFRHRFAKNFIEKNNDIAFLADLMGHESIETTRIYLRKSEAEQRDIVNKVVTW